MKKLLSIVILIICGQFLTIGVFAGSDGIVQIYTTDMDELLEIATSRVTRQLTAEEKEMYGVLDW